jgi:nicotinamide mononucleotide (NMN) deamidase PncC
MQMLGVAPAYLARLRRVSEPVARAMALGALSHQHGAGVGCGHRDQKPSGETPTKRVGTVASLGRCAAIRRWPHG